MQTIELLPTVERFQKYIIVINPIVELIGLSTAGKIKLDNEIYTNVKQMKINTMFYRGAMNPFGF